VRLFVAVQPPPAVLDHLADAVGGLAVSTVAEQGINARVAARHLWHVTLAFLGEVPDEQAERAVEALDRAGATAAPVRLRIAGGGRFGKGRFTVLWVGLGGEVPVLRALAQSVTAQLRHARLPYDRKPFRPHLTIARPGDRLAPEQLAADLAALDGYEGPEWTVTEVVLMRSHLGPKPTHDLVHAAKLGAPGSA
jgi:2'-5' RNA ligase